MLQIFPEGKVSETNEERVEERNPEGVDIPDCSFGFRFYDKTEVQLDSENLEGDRRNVSGRFYSGRRVIEADEILDNPGQ